MKKNKIIILIFILMLFTGCTKTLKDEKNNIVKYEKTNQILTENILCKPTNEEVIKLYEENKVNIEKLPDCKDFKINEGKYEGLWNSFIVKPLTWLLIKIGLLVNNYGLSLIIIGLLIRVLLMPVTKTTALQSENLKKAQPEINAIEKKYKDKNDQESITAKSKETMLIYKKYNINPLSSCLFAVLQIPLFIGFIEAINRTPAIFEGKFMFLKLGTTPFAAIQNGQYYYIIIVILIGLSTYFSFKLNKTAPIPNNNKNQMQTMNKVMVGFITIMSFSLSIAIGLYWITSSVFTIFQNLLVKRGEKNEKI